MHLQAELAEAFEAWRLYQDYEVHTDPETGEHLAVAVVARPGSEVSLELVLAFLRAGGMATRKLPEQLVIWGEPLPRTASGKVIRARLAMDAPSKPSMSVKRLQTNPDT